MRERVARSFNFSLIEHAAKLPKKILMSIANLRLLFRTKQGGQMFFNPLITMPDNAVVLQSEIERLTGFGIENPGKWHQFQVTEKGARNRQARTVKRWPLHNTGLKPLSQARLKAPILKIL
jgi:hypothetical protein